jgi:hypothetical protein
MRLAGLAGLGLIAWAAGSSPSVAQSDVKGMDKVGCPKTVTDIATCYSTKLETGAYLLAAMPKSWNGDLIVFAHGGPSVTPPAASDSQGALGNAVAVKRGFAWIGSSYRKEGYGVQMAAADTEDARKFFIEHFPKPQRTILHGTSYGGLVGAKLLEKYAKNADGSLNYDGAFFNSGVVGGWVANYEFRADLRAVYQYYCKNLPKPDEVQYPLWMGMPVDSKLTLRDLAATIDECTGVAKPANGRSELQKQNLVNILGVMRIPESMLVRHMQAATFVFREIAGRVTNGKNAFSNVNVRYTGSTDDAALNKGIARFDADPAAFAALNADAQPTGALAVPVVSIHSMNDPQAAVEGQYEYRERVKAAGNADYLVQAYTDENQHAAQSPPEMAAALDGLLQWIEKGTKPSAESIAAACSQLRETYDGPCRWHTEYQPKPLNTRFARAGN